MILLSRWARSPYWFGPVLFAEIVRMGRRDRYLMVRCAYGSVLLTMMLVVYAYWFPELLGEPALLFSSSSLPAAHLADFSASFFSVFMIVQSIVVLILTPAFTAGAIAEEKESDTLDSLLVTDLSSREIVVGKLAARLANLMLIVLLGLPILGAVQFLGGVDPNLVLAAFAVTGLNMLSLAGLSILFSVLVRRPRDAIFRTYLVALLYSVGSGASWLLLLPQLDLASFPSTDTWNSPVTIEDAVEWLSIGNFVAALAQLQYDVEHGESLAKILPVALKRYAWFHLAIGIVAIVGAVLLFRRSALHCRPAIAVDSAAKERPPDNERVCRGRPKVWHACVVWKELFVDTDSRHGPIVRLMAGVLLAVVFWPVLQMCYFFGRIYTTGPTDDLIQGLNTWCVGVTLLLAGLMLLQIVVRAAGAISTERDRRTLDGLLITPMSNRALLFGKWLGSILAPRNTALCLLLVWGICLWIHAIEFATLVGFFTAWLVFANVLAGLGLWFSITSRKTHRAILWALLIFGLMNCINVIAVLDLPEPWIKPFSILSLTPPGILTVLAMTGTKTSSTWQLSTVLSSPVIPSIVCAWAWAAFILWMLMFIRFQVVTGRERKQLPRVVPVERCV